MRPNWHHGQHPPACTCVDCERNRRAGGGPTSARQPQPKGGNQEARVYRECEAYIAKVCRHFNIRVPLLIIDDRLQNPGACGEAGQSTVWVQRRFILAASRQDREAVLRHELAHIAVHNTPGLGDVEAHGPEFRRELVRLGGDRMTGQVQPVSIAPAGDSEEVGSRFFRYTLGLAILGFLAFVMLRGWVMPMLPDWLVGYVAPVDDFIRMAYFRWPIWTVVSGWVLGVVGAILLAKSDS